MLREDAERPTTLLPPPSDNARDYIGMFLARAAEVVLAVDDELELSCEFETLPSPA